MRTEGEALARAEESIEKNRKSDAVVKVVDKDRKGVAGAQVSVEMVRHEFLFGSNIFQFDRLVKDEENARYKELFKGLLNYATVGFYWRLYEPEKGKPMYDYTDKVVGWCQENGIRMKGHPLLWDVPEGVPTWSKKQPAAKLQKARVTEIVQRYAKKIEFWEVVNESAHYPNLPIDEPYKWARKADPWAHLIVNDYYVLFDGCPDFFALLKRAIADNVPFDGIGIQAHDPATERFNLDYVWKVLTQYASLGKRLHIAEFTPLSGGEEMTGSEVKGKWSEATQAEYAVKFYTVCFAHPAMMGITWWDLMDGHAFREGGGMVRKDLTPKPAYEALKELIHNKWKTKTTGTSDGEGRFGFRGFRGEYVAKVSVGGKVTEQKFRVGEEEKAVEVRVGN